jgi:hypothetical protein
LILQTVTALHWSLQTPSRAFHFAIEQRFFARSMPTTPAEIQYWKREKPLQ